MKRVWVPEEEIKLDKRIKPEDLKSIVFTKIGEFEDEDGEPGEPLWWILKRNKENDDKCGEFWWGFNIMKIIPEIVQKFVEVSKDKVWLVMAKTYKQEKLEWRGGKKEKDAYRSFNQLSDYYKRGSDTGFSDLYNTENNKKGKKSIPKGIFTGGHCALIAHHLKRVDFRIDLCSYRVYNDNDTYLCNDKYNRQNDTHCATFVKKPPCSPYHSRQKQIYYVAEMCEPYGVYLYD